MTGTDLQGARAYALERLERQLEPSLTYHSLGHTRDEVVPAAERLASLEGIGAHERLLLVTAAWFHDLGFVERRVEHETVGARLAAEALPGLGYAPVDVEAVQGMIMATRLPQTPRTLLEQILADADLDVLGRQDFAIRNRALREELESGGAQITDEQWFSGQCKFLESHAYFTAAARGLRDEPKRRNLELVRGWLEAGRLTP